LKETNFFFFSFFPNSDITFWRANNLDQLV